MVRELFQLARRGARLEVFVSFGGGITRGVNPHFCDTLGNLPREVVG